MPLGSLGLSIGFAQQDQCAPNLIIPSETTLQEVRSGARWARPTTYVMEHNDTTRDDFVNPKRQVLTDRFIAVVCIDK